MPSEKRTVDKKALLVGLLVGLVVFFGLSYTWFFVKKGQIERDVIKFYELAFPNSKVEVVSLSREHGLIKAFLKITQNGQPGYREVYVSNDGKVITESIIYLQESTERIQKFKDFVDCLYDKGARVYGLSNDTATILQLNLLGRYSPKIYVPCDNRINECIQMGIKSVPTFVYNNTGYPGVLTIDYIANITGCPSPV